MVKEAPLGVPWPVASARALMITLMPAVRGEVQSWLAVPTLAIPLREAGLRVVADQVVPMEPVEPVNPVTKIQNLAKMTTEVAAEAGEISGSLKMTTPLLGLLEEELPSERKHRREKLMTWTRP